MAIIETGSLVKASEKLNITQSTVTMRLKALEDEVGQKLLVRARSGVSLTAAGTKLLSYAHIIDGLWGQALRATSLPQGLSHIYHFGCSVTLWDMGGRQLFNAMRAHEAGFALSVQQSDETVLTKALNDGTIDLCLVSDPVIRKSQRAIRLADCELRLYSDRQNTPLRFDNQYVYVDYGAEFRRKHDEYYYDAGAARLGFNTPQMALSHILEFGGSVYLPKTMIDDNPPSSPLFEMTKAPHFTLERYLLITQRQDDDWHWLDNVLAETGLLSRRH